MTLSSRLKTLLDENPSKTQAGLARATGAKPASISDWVNDRTKSINSKYLTNAANYFGVSSDWLSTGKGPKEPQGIINQAMAGLSPTGGLGTVSNRDSIQTLGEHFKTMSPGRKAAILSLLAEYEKDPDRITKEIEMLLGGGGDDSTIR